MIIMPNHVHGIIFIIDECRGEVISPPDQSNLYNLDGETLLQGRETLPLRKPTLGQIMGYFKYQATRAINEADNTGTIARIWQRNYYEHIIRDEKELQEKTDYIFDNPSRWEEDIENPGNKKSSDSI
ncbi:MAG TPA: hypothetical protein VLE49_20800 [Anaerolineales bacterium]|nr:hypothetical protein [Anaerolineales bacterium]